LSLRSMVQVGSGISVSDVCLVRKCDTFLSIVDYLLLGSSLSVRGLCRLGATASVVTISDWEAPGL